MHIIQSLEAPLRSATLYLVPEKQPGKPPKLKKRLCVCGCGASFRSTRIEDRYASQACLELAVHNPSHIQSKQHVVNRLMRELMEHAVDLPPNFDPSDYINGSELALKLGVTPSAVSVWVREGIIPSLKLSQSLRRFKIEDVRSALSTWRLGKKKK